MRWGVLSALVSVSANAAPIVGPPIALDNRQLARPDAVHAAAMGEEVLVAWNTQPIGPFTVFLAMLQSDGGVRALTPTSVLGNHTGASVRVAAAQVEPLWIVGWPDWGSGGQTGGTRVFKDGGLPDSYGIAFAGRSYSSRMRMAATPTGFRVLENAAGRSAIELRVTPTSLSPQPFQDRPQITTDTFDVAATRDELVEVWAAADGGLVMLRELFDGGGLTTTVSPWTPEDLAIATSDDAVFVLEQRRDGGSSDLWLSRTSPGALTSEALDRPGATHPALTSGPSRLWLTFVQAGAVQVQRRGDSRAERVWTGAVARPAVAPLDDDRAWVTWAETTDAGLQAFAALVDFRPQSDAGVSDAGPLDAGAPDAGASDAGAPDAGTLDAGADDAGAPDAGTTDAGVFDAGLIDDGGLPAAEAGMLAAVIRPKQFTVGCSATDSAGWVLTVWWLLGARRRGVRARPTALAVRD